MVQNGIGRKGSGIGSPPFISIAYALRPGDFRLLFCPGSFCVEGNLLETFFIDFYILYKSVIARLTRSKP